MKEKNLSDANSSPVKLKKYSEEEWRDLENRKSLSEKYDEDRDWIGEPPELSDEQIKEMPFKMGIASTIACAYFIEGAQWYREQIRNFKKDNL